MIDNIEADWISLNEKLFEEDRTQYEGWHKWEIDYHNQDSDRERLEEE